MASCKTEKNKPRRASAGRICRRGLRDPDATDERRERKRFPRTQREFQTGWNSFDAVLLRRGGGGVFDSGAIPSDHCAYRNY